MAAMEIEMTMKTKHVSLLISMMILAATVAMSVSGCVGHSKITEKDRVASNGYYKLAVNSYTDGKVIMAIKDLEEARKYNPRNAEVENLFGLIYLGKRMFDQAESSFKLAIEINPEFSDAYLNLSTIYMQREQWDKAIETLQYPVSDLTYRAKPMAYDNMGWCYHMKGDDIRALEYLILSTSEDPKLCHAWYNMGLIYKGLAKYPEAIRSFDTLLKVEGCSKYLYAWYELGIVSVRAKDFDRARTALTKCVELGGSGVEASECRNYLRMLK